MSTEMALNVLAYNMKRVIAILPGLCGQRWRCSVVALSAIAAMGRGTDENFMEMAKNAAEEYFDGRRLGSSTNALDPEGRHPPPSRNDE